MAKIQQPADIEIAALKRKVVQQGNLMQAGSGTPWEDRGQLGLVKAFFVTCFKSLFSPSELWDQIRRPETTSDATFFALWCGLIAGISWVTHSLWWDLFYSGNGLKNGVPPMLIKDDPQFSTDWSTWGVGAALQLFCAVAGTVLLLRLSNYLYQKLIPHALASRVPSALTYNVLAYALGPVLLVLIPAYGWVAALVWLFFLFIGAGMRRLRLGAGTSIISAILTTITVFAVGFGVYFAGDFAWSYITGTAVTYTPPPKDNGPT